MLRRIINRTTSTCLIVLASLAFWPDGISNALLIEKDLISAGDRLITLDTETGLEWLDLTETLGESYNSVSGGFGGFTTNLGFSFADTEDVHTLYANAGIIDFTGSMAVVGNYTAALELFAKLGCTGNCDPPDAIGRFQEGFHDLVPLDPLQVGISAIQIFDASVGAAAGVPTATGSKGGSSPEIGSYLIRPIPEPSTGVLLAIGLLGLGIGSKRRGSVTYGA